MVFLTAYNEKIILRELKNIFNGLIQLEYFHNLGNTQPWQCYQNPEKNIKLSLNNHRLRAFLNTMAKIFESIYVVNNITNYLHI